MRHGWPEKHTHVTIPNFVAVDQAVSEQVWGPKILWGRWVPAPSNMGVVDPLMHFALHARFGHFRSNCTGIIMDTCQKFLTPHPCSFSRSLKVIETDTDRSATYDFLLVLRSNYRPISYRFRDRWQYLKKYPLLVFYTPLTGSLGIL